MISQPFLRWILISILLTSPSPRLTGIATYYGEQHTGKLTRSGEVFDPDVLACAVDANLYHELYNKWLLVKTDDNAVLVRVNDSGYLADAGVFSWQRRRIGEYDVEWFFPAAEGYNIVVDLTPKAYQLLQPRGLVKIYVGR